MGSLHRFRINTQTPRTNIIKATKMTIAQNMSGNIPSSTKYSVIQVIHTRNGRHFYFFCEWLFPKTLAFQLHCCIWRDIRDKFWLHVVLHIGYYLYSAEWHDSELWHNCCNILMLDLIWGTNCPSSSSERRISGIIIWTSDSVDFISGAIVNTDATRIVIKIRCVIIKQPTHMYNPFAGGLVVKGKKSVVTSCITWIKKNELD